MVHWKCKVNALYELGQPNHYTFWSVCNAMVKTETIHNVMLGKHIGTVDQRMLNAYRLSSMAYTHRSFTSLG